MSAYLSLSCKDCETTINFGKLIRTSNGDMRLQGMHSEKLLEWVSDIRLWDAVQSFLWMHQGHSLIFSNDDDMPDVQLFKEIGFDELSKSKIKN
jgi:hypothetical protein